MNSLCDIRIFLGLVPKESHCTSVEGRMLRSPVPETYTLNMYSCPVLSPARALWDGLWQCSDEQVCHDNDIRSSPVEIVLMKSITRAKRMIAKNSQGTHADNRYSFIVIRPDFLAKRLSLPVRVAFGGFQV